MTDDPRRYAPSAARNLGPISRVLDAYLPTRGLVLEVASGTGEHITAFASAHPDLMFQPTDPDSAARASIDAWTAVLGLTNVRGAIDLDAQAPDWPLAAADAVVCINMIHISPWAATVGLIGGAARVLPNGGVLFIYGPFHRDGRPTSPGNASFDADLRSRNAEWGLRDLEAVAAIAKAVGFAEPTIEEMPANNLSLIFRRLKR